MTELAPLMTTGTGSLPRPHWLGATARARVTFSLEGDALEEAMRDATALVLKEQEDLGIDIVTDGEQRRESFVYQAATTWDGVDLVNLAVKTRYRARDDIHNVARIVGPIRRRCPALLGEVTTAKALSKRPLKVAIAGPLTIVDSTLDEHYRDEAQLAMDAAAAINEEMLDLQEAGADFLQLDEPAMTRYHDKVFAFGAAALDRCLEGIKVPAFVHLCYGYPLGQKQQHHFTYPELLDRLMDTRISGFTVEFGRSPFDPAVLAPYKNKLVMFGCIDPGNTPAPSVEDVKSRVAAALRHVSPTRLLLAPDCGLMTISRKLAHEKLAVMVQAARELRATL
jgi:5-methyltetrahydropteroyltriglutamate--homocysteine methyltransferase